MNLAIRLPRDIFSFARAVMAALLLAALVWFSIVMMQRNTLVHSPPPSKKSSFPLEKMLTGPLSLKENPKSAFALSLEQKLVFLAQSVRPDFQNQEAVFCVGVKGTDQKKVIHEGEAICCQITKHESGGVKEIFFAEEAPNLMMTPYVLEGGSLLLKMGEEEIVLPGSVDALLNKKLGKEMTLLQEAKWWGTDQFFRLYGGEQYRSFGQKQKVQLGEDFLYLSAGDFLSFTEGKWEVLRSLKEASKNALLAKVSSIQGNALELQAWDSEGVLCVQKSLSLQSPGVLDVALSGLIAEPKLRSAKQISCQLEKKRIVLKEGDWLLRKKSGWHKLRNLEEIDAYLQHQVQGVLFVVDQVEPRGFLKGNLFDPMRTRVEQASIPISQKSTETGRKGVGRK